MVKKMIPDNATFKNYALLLFNDSSQYLTWYKNTLCIVASANALFSVNININSRMLLDIALLVVNTG